MNEIPDVRQDPENDLMMLVDGEHMHIGRSWDGPGPMEADCPCHKAPCGLVDTPSPACDQHPWTHYRTIRTAHRACTCPGAPQ